MSPSPADRERRCTRWPTDGWRESTPREQGVDAELLAWADREVRERLANVQSPLVVRHGHLVFERYYRGHGPDDPFDTRSVTKSVTATLVGMASAQGLLPPLRTSLLSLFAKRVVANRDPRKDAITIEDLLTMRPGLECVERGDPWRQGFDQERAGGAIAIVAFVAHVQRLSDDRAQVDAVWQRP